MNAELLELKDAGLRLSESFEMRNLNLRVASGEMIAILGPNGAGKSTLLEILAGLRKAGSGTYTLLGEPIDRWHPGQLARRLAYVPQSLRGDLPFLAMQVVLMGRNPHYDGWFERAEDREAAETAMREAGCWELREREFRTLSGGEKQRVIFAAALAQDTDLLLLDEPAAFLDLAHQLQLCRMLRTLAAKGKSCIAVLHDPNLAATFFPRALVMHNGLIGADGPTQEVLRQDLVTRVFGEGIRVERNPLGGIWIGYES